MDGTDLIVFVMARGGSTRIPLKNIAKLGSRTILSYTLEDVCDLQREYPRTACVLMTDHSAVKESAEIDRYRPDNFEIVGQTEIEASDSQEWLGVQRVLAQKESGGRFYQYVMMMGADNVLRSSNLLADGYRTIQELKNPRLMVQSAIPVPIRYHPCRVLMDNPNEEESLQWPKNTEAILSQDYPKCYARTGGVFVVRRSLIHGDFLHIEKHTHLLATEDCMEIDTPEDLEAARLVIAPRARSAMRIEDFCGQFHEQEITIVAGGKSTVDYHRAVTTKNVVLINYALNLAPLFPDQRLFHVTLHPEILCSHPNLRLPNVVPVVGQWWESVVPKDIEGKTLLYRTKQFPDLESPDLAMTMRDLEGCSKEGVLCHVANSSHCAIHLAWLWGPRRIRIVGASEYRGQAVPGYDDRLSVPESVATQITSPQYYISSFRRFVGLLDWDDVAYLGY